MFLLDYLNTSLSSINPKKKTAIEEIFSGEIITINECKKCNEIKQFKELCFDLAIPVINSDPNTTEDDYIQTQQKNKK